MGRAVQKFGDPRKPERTKRVGRDNGEPVVYRKHQIAGDYKTNWERYQRARSLQGDTAQQPGGGYRVMTPSENNLGYWQQSIITFYCQTTPNYGRIMHLDIPAGRWKLRLAAGGNRSIWRFSREPKDCGDINTIPLEPIETVPPVGGQVEFLLESTAPGFYTISGPGEGYACTGPTYLGLRLVDYQPFLINLEADG
jgi:hypothetical protein